MLEVIFNYMSEFKEIIDYLQLVKPKTPSTKKAIEIVDKNYNDTELAHEEDLTIIDEKDLQNGFYTNLGKEITTSELYLKYESSQILYYVKNEITINNLPTNQYKTIPLGLSDVWETLDETYLIKIDVDSTSGYYYSHEIKRIVFVNNLEDVIAFDVDVIPFIPNDLKLTNGDFNLVKEDLTNDVDKYLGNKELIKRDFNKISHEKKKLKFSKATKSGIIHLLPNIKLQSNQYLLSYHYYQKGIPITWGTTDEVAINIEFAHPVSFLEYLNHTIFYDFDNISSFENNKNRALFLDLYLEIIKNILNKSSNFIDKLIVLNYVPAYIHKTQGNYYLWNILDQAINSGIIYNNGKITVDDFVVHLLEGIYLSYENKSIFLSEMLHIINNKTRLEHLHFHIDSENNVKIINLLYTAWKQTRFINPSIEENHEFKNSNGPIFLPYESEKWAGLYFSNANIEIVKQKITVALETGRYEEVEVSNPKFAGGKGKAKREIIENYNYHPFHPIYINNIEKQDTTIAFESIIPAFLLYVNENKAWWNNFVKTGEYIIDGITIASGFASLKAAKYFAHVARLAETAEGVTAANKVAQASNILKNIKNAAGVVEISSGSVNLILKLTDLDETEFGQSLSKVLFYLELITLAGELTVPLKDNLKKSAREAIDNADGVIRLKHADLFNELNSIAYGTKLTSVAELQKFLKENGILDEIDLVFVEKISFGRADLAESLLLSLKQIQKGKNIDELVKLFKIIDPPKLASLTNYEARIWYTWKKTKIEQLISKEKTLEAKAKKAFDLRNEYRSATRKYMKDRKWAEHLERVETNQEWENLLARTLKKDKISTLEGAYKEIIEKSMSGRDDVDKLFKLEK